MEIILHVLFFIVISTLLAVVYYNFKFVKYLEIKFPSVWEKLNKPRWIPSTLPKDKLLMKAFEDGNEHLKLNDPEFTALVNFRKKLNIFCIFLFCLYAGAFIAAILKK